MGRPKSRSRDFRQRRSHQSPQNPAARASKISPSFPSEHLLFGLHAVRAALENPKRAIRHAYLTENAAAKLALPVAARPVATTIVHPEDLEALTGGAAVHQGAVLDAEPLVQPDLDDFLASLLETTPARVVVLDQVTDPHNVGAVLRSACAFGIAALIVQDRHSPPLSGTLAKAASGGLEYVKVISAVNLRRALDRLKEHGFQCIGFDSEAADEFAPKSAAGAKVAFVFGAEDKGLRRLIREGCDALYALQMPGPIKSLNISNAAAIVFYEAAKARQL